MSKVQKTMFDLKDVNIRLRSIILEHALHLEFHSREIIFYILRTLKEDSKTLGNQSSSLSYKAKIDILYDLDEITPEQYNGLIKQMEIRNQFIHNYDIDTFSNLIADKPEFRNYLDKNYKNESEDIEERYFRGYLDLYNHCSAWLIMLKQQFRAGLAKAYEKFIDYNLINQLDDVLALADQKYLKQKEELISALGSIEEVGDIPYQINEYKRLLKLSIAEKSLEIYEATKDTDGMKKVLTHKHSTRDQIKDSKRKKGKAE
ncbi:MAG: hypothetical protein WKF91_20405 [Segetibacter sp.]